MSEQETPIDNGQPMGNGTADAGKNAPPAPVDESKDPRWLDDRLERARRIAKDDLAKALGYDSSDAMERDIKDRRGREEQAMKEQGKFRDLYDKAVSDMGALKVKADAYDALLPLLEGELEADLAAFSDVQREAMKELLDLAGQDIIKKRQVITRMKSLFAQTPTSETPTLASKPQAPSLDAGAGTKVGKSGKVERTPEEIRSRFKI